ncbi:MAG TPA: adenylate/guanylate cyclase domain-containing protein [Candidatus Limnocylindrales bacterium]|nr:adenylate/guanylate cyclase domain-containing protein [Candidatus Limnocylindrales bacterium]
MHSAGDAGDSAREEVWRSILLGTDPRYRRARSIFKRIPSEPRCKMCAAPFGAPGSIVARLTGRDRWPKNPKYCAFCFRVLQTNHGGAEIEASYLFADVRGSTPLAERVGAREFRRQLDRFYEIATRVLVDHDAIVDKFVGDEVIGIFIPALTHDQHARRAIEAAAALLVATGHGSTGGPSLPIGAGVHTGTAFVGSVGDPPTTELTALGDVVNVTARLASLAGPGETLVTTDAATAAALDTSRLERRVLELKGKTGTTTVWVRTTPAAEAAATS